MPRFSVQFDDRQFNPVQNTFALTYVPTRFSVSAQWGCKSAEIEVIGDERGLWALLENLRYGVTILDEFGTPCWWGFVAEVEVSVGAYTIGLSLDSMANRIAVAYNQVEAGQTETGDRATTDWAQDDTSVATFGTKEALLTLSDASTDAATRYRNAALGVGKYPVPTISLHQGQGATATLRCRGWHEILGWRYFQNAGEGARYIYVTADGETFVTTNDYTAIGQTFQLGGAFGCSVTTVRLRAQKIGAPSANLTCELWTNGAGVPGTLLATRSITAASVGTAVDWVSFDFTSANLTLSPATTYWIVVYGTTDASNTYQVGVSTAQGYGGGQGQQAPSGVWASAGWDMFFEVNATRDTTDVIKDIVLTYGQSVFGLVVSSQASGVIGTGYGDGDTTALQVIEDQLNSGTTGATRLLARVESNRSVSLAPEPASNLNPSFLLEPDGTIKTTYNIPIDPWMCPCGGYARLQGVIPAAVDLTTISNAKLIFIEEAEYDVTSNQLNLTPRGQTNVFDLGRL